MAVKTFWLLNTAAATPFFGGSLQDGGSAPTAANASFGWVIGTATAGAAPMWRARIGASAAATVSSTTSFIDSASGPTKGTGATNTTAGDSFRTPTALSGTFAAGIWTGTFVFRSTAGTAGALRGLLKTRIWASANADGSSARDLSAFAGGFNTGLITLNALNTDFTGTASIDTTGQPDIVLNNEFLFFQCEWSNGGNGGASQNVIFRIGASNIVTPNLGASGVTGSGSPQEANKDTAASSGGTVAWNASGSPTEPNKDTAAATGSVAWVATGAASEGADSASGTGGVAWLGAGAATEGSDTAAGTGLVLDIVAGSGAATEGVDTAAGAGSVAFVDVTGSGAPTEGTKDTAGGSGTVAWLATGAAIEGADTAAGTGTVLAVVTGSGAVTEPSKDIAAGTGNVVSADIVGSGAATEPGKDIAAGSGTVAFANITGAGAAVEGADTASGSGTVTDVVTPPVEPPGSYTGGRAGPLYRTRKLRREKKREELEELLELVRAQIPVEPGAPPPPLPSGLALTDLMERAQLAPTQRTVVRRAVVSDDEDDDEEAIALLLELLS